jgi:antitoxin (DNA-binding transcriptional repressor) of toxin-antitoxin stability system
VSTITIDVTDLPGRLTEILELAKGGTEVLVTDAADPVARFVPVGKPGRVIFGMHPGAMTTRDDFNDPITEDDFFRGDV